jgi:nucleotide-binding universal stress UspA family protein
MTNGGQELVVVGVDGSTESVAALRWAAGYAAAADAQLRAVLAWHYPSAVGPAPIGKAPASISDEVRASMTEHLTTAIAEAAEGVDVEQQIDYGHPAEVLVGQSDEADLLVVGNRGHGALTGMLGGSVSIHCVTHARCPVVVVRGPDVH